VIIPRPGRVPIIVPDPVVNGGGVEASWWMVPLAALAIFAAICLIVFFACRAAEFFSA